MRCATLDSLLRLNIPLGVATAIRRVWKDDDGPLDKAREYINTLINGHGVEFLGVHRETNADMHYVNMGDPYRLTIVFIGTQLVVANWGYYVERKIVRPIQ